MSKFILSVCLFVIAALGSGCVTQLKSERSPGVDLGAIRKIHVVRLPADERGIDRLIAERLNLMGREATHGAKTEMPAGTQALLTYQDKWMWDITMYMIELNAQVRRPDTEIAIATGRTFRTSLARKSPPDLVEELLVDLFAEPATSSK